MFRRLLLVYGLLISVIAFAQQDWDAMDVLDGPNPTLRYGFYTETSGRIMMGRYYFIDDGDNLRVRLAPFGKTAVELPVQKYDRENGVLELAWEGHPERRCRLEQQNEGLFLGNCVERLAVMPIAIRIANEFDVEWQGTYFPVSETDLDIVARAMQILKGQDRRNLDGDRNCDDDVESGTVSVFCALYIASLEIDGTYRHRRPAMQAARDALRSRYPGEYVHTLRDINNNPEISDIELIDALDSARSELRTSIGTVWE